MSFDELFNHERLGKATVAYALNDFRIDGVAVQLVIKLARKNYSSLSLVIQNLRDIMD